MVALFMLGTVLCSASLLTILSKSSANVAETFRLRRGLNPTVPTTANDNRAIEVRSIVDRLLSPFTVILNTYGELFATQLPHFD